MLIYTRARHTSKKINSKREKPHIEKKTYCEVFTKKCPQGILCMPTEPPEQMNNTKANLSSQGCLEKEVLTDSQYPPITCRSSPSRSHLRSGEERIIKNVLFWSGIMDDFSAWFPLDASKTDWTGHLREPGIWLHSPGLPEQEIEYAWGDLRRMRLDALLK